MTKRRMPAEITLNSALKKFSKAAQYGNEWLDQSGLPSLAAYVRCITSHMPDVFPLELTKEGGIIITGPDKREFSVVPLATDMHDRWECALVGDDMGMLSVEIDVSGWNAENKIIEKFYVWCHLRCPPDDVVALDDAERSADDMISAIRTEQAKTMRPSSRGRDAEPF